MTSPGSPPAAAMAEEFLDVACHHEGTGVEEPDFLAVVDATDGSVMHETPMPNIGDELHHIGWNRGRTGYTRPHTVRSLPGGEGVVISMLGDAEGNGAGGFGYQPRRNVSASTAWFRSGCAGCTTRTPPRVSWQRRCQERSGAGGAAAAGGWQSR